MTSFVLVHCTDDAAVTPEFSRHVCRERLGIEPLEIPGDHSPFLADPGGLADLLITLDLNADGAPDG